MKRVSWLVVPAILLGSLTARAQIVDVQPLVGAETRDGFSGVVEGALDWRTGNTELLLVGGTGLLRYKDGRHLVFLTGKKEFGMQGGVDFVDRDFEHLRYRVDLLPRLQGETFVQHDADDFRRLGLRVLWGIGPRVTLVTSPSADVAVGAAYMLELEKLKDGLEPDAGEETLAHRLSAYVMSVYKVDTRLRLSGTIYAQPRLDDFGDARILAEGDVIVAFTGRLSFKTSVVIAYDSLPPFGRKDLDTAVKSALQFTF